MNSEYQTPPHPDPHVCLHESHTKLCSLLQLTKVQFWGSINCIDKVGKVF